jgi:hypothetical protein
VCAARPRGDRRVGLARSVRRGRARGCGAGARAGRHAGAARLYMSTPSC